MEKYTLRGMLSPVLFCLCLVTSLTSVQASSFFFPNLADSINVKIEGDFFICENDTNKLSVSAEYDEILWSVEGSQGNIITEDLSSSEVEIDEAGIYKVVVKDLVDGELLTGEAEIKVQLSKVFGGISPEHRNELCLGESIDLTAFGGAQTFNSYSWGEPINEMTSNVTVSPTESTTYTLQVTNANSCESSYSYTVDVNPNPTASLTEYVAEACDNSSFMIGVSENEGFQYHWNTGDNTPSITKNLRKNDEVFAVTVTNEFNCSVELETEPIKLVAKDPLSLYTANKIFPINSSKNFELQGISNEDCFDSFIWKIDGVTVEGQTESIALLTFDNTNNKQLVCVEPQESADCTCSYEPYCIEVFVANEGDCTGEISKDKFETCINGTVLLDGDSSPGASSILEGSSWTINGIVVSESTSNPVFEVSDYTGKDEKSSSLELTMKKAGIYDVIWSFQYQGCSKTREAKIEVFPNPEIDVIFDSSVDCVGDDFAFFINGKNANSYNYLLTYSSNDQQATLDLSSGSPNSIVYNDVQDDINLKLIELQDEDTGCLIKFDNQVFNKTFYSPLTVTVDTNCIDGEGLYYSEITAKNGSGDYEFIGAGVTSGNVFETETLVEGNGTLVEVNDKKCPSFNQKVESYVTCSCIDQPIQFEIGNYEGCVGGSIFVPIEIGPTFSKGQDNTLFYEIHSTKGSTDTLVTGIIDLSDCEVFEECEVEIPYNEALLVDQTYNLVSYISKNVPGTDSIDRNYNCFNYFSAKEIPVTLKYKNVKILELNTTKDTVCLNQKNQVFGVNNVPFKYSVDWSSDSEGISFEEISPYHISASFTESGDKQIKMTQSFESGKGSVCTEEQVIDVFVKKDEAPEQIDISLVPGNILVAKTEKYDCFEWGYYNVDNGDVVNGPSTKFWILSTVNLNKFVYYVDVWKCGTECKSRTYFNRDIPFVFVTGNNEIENKDYKIYPNPTASDIFIEGLENPMEAKVYLINALGQRLDLESVVVQGNKLLVRISNLDVSGLHYITVENSDHKVLIARGLMIR